MAANTNVKAEQYSPEWELSRELIEGEFANELSDREDLAWTNHDIQKLADIILSVKQRTDDIFEVIESNEVQNDLANLIAFYKNKNYAAGGAVSGADTLDIEWMDLTKPDFEAIKAFKGVIGKNVIVTPKHPKEHEYVVQVIYKDNDGNGSGGWSMGGSTYDEAFEKFITHVRLHARTLARGGNVGRDRKFLSRQYWEQAYKSKRVKRGKIYRRYDGGGVINTGTLKSETFIFGDTKAVGKFKHYTDVSNDTTLANMLNDLNKYQIPFVAERHAAHINKPEFWTIMVTDEERDHAENILQPYINENEVEFEAAQYLEESKFSLGGLLIAAGVGAAAMFVVDKKLNGDRKIKLRWKNPLEKIQAKEHWEIQTPETGIWEKITPKEVSAFFEHIKFNLQKFADREPNDHSAYYVAELKAKMEKGGLLNSKLLEYADITPEWWETRYEPNRRGHGKFFPYLFEKGGAIGSALEFLESLDLDQLPKEVSEKLREIMEDEETANLDINDPDFQEMKGFIEEKFASAIKREEPKPEPVKEVVVTPIPEPKAEPKQEPKPQPVVVAPKTTLAMLKTRVKVIKGMIEDEPKNKLLKIRLKTVEGMIEDWDGPVPATAAQIEETKKAIIEYGEGKDFFEENRVTSERIAKLLNAGYTKEEVLWIFVGYQTAMPILAEGEIENGGRPKDVSMVSGIFSYMEDYIDKILDSFVENALGNSFELGLKYPTFNWKTIIKKYNIASEWVIVTRKNYRYQIFIGNELVIGKMLSSGEEITDPKGEFNNDYWGIVSSSKETIKEIAATLVKQKSGYIKDIAVFMNDLGGVGWQTLKENGVEYADGGLIGSLKESLQYANTNIIEQATQFAGGGSIIEKLKGTLQGANTNIIDQVMNFEKGGSLVDKLAQVLAGANTNIIDQVTKLADGGSIVSKLQEALDGANINIIDQVAKLEKGGWLAGLKSALNNADADIISQVNKFAQGGSLIASLTGRIADANTNIITQVTKNEFAEGGVVNFEIERINKRYGVEMTPTDSDKSRYQITSGFNTLNLINRYEFNGAGILQNEKGKYVLYTPNIFAKGGKVSLGAIDPNKIYTSADAIEHKRNFGPETEFGRNAKGKIVQSFNSPLIEQFFIEGVPVDKCFTHNGDDNAINDLGRMLWELLTRQMDESWFYKKAVDRFIYNSDDFYPRFETTISFWKKHGVKEEDIELVVKQLKSATRNNVTYKIQDTSKQQYPNQYASGGELAEGKTFTYHINLDERGDFYADVRNENDETVFEIKAGASLEEDQTSIFEDGYMKHKEDLAGLEEYLVELGIITKSDRLIDADGVYASGGQVHTSSKEGKLVFKADTKGGKYSLEVLEVANGKYRIENFTNGDSKSSGGDYSKAVTIDRVLEDILGSKKVDGINYIIGVDLLGIKDNYETAEKEYDIKYSKEFRDWKTGVSVAWATDLGTQIMKDLSALEGFSQMSNSEKEHTARKMFTSAFVKEFISQHPNVKYKQGGRVMVQTIEDVTDLMPEVIAGMIARNVIMTKWEDKLGAGNIKQEHDKKISTEINDWVEFLTQRAEGLFQNSADFRKKISASGNTGRDNLYKYMKHWMGVQAGVFADVAADAKPMHKEAEKALKRWIDAGRKFEHGGSISDREKTFLVGKPYKEGKVWAQDKVTYFYDGSGFLECHSTYARKKEDLLRDNKEYQDISKAPAIDTKPFLETINALNEIFEEEEENENPTKITLDNIHELSRNENNSSVWDIEYGDGDFGWLNGEAISDKGIEDDMVPLANYVRGLKKIEEQEYSRKQKSGKKSAKPQTKQAIEKELHYKTIVDKMNAIESDGLNDSPTKITIENLQSVVEDGSNWAIEYGSGDFGTFKKWALDKAGITEADMQDLADYIEEKEQANSSQKNKFENGGAIGEAGDDLRFLVDQLSNSMEFYTEDEFVEELAGKTQYKVDTLKKVFKAYWALDAMSRNDYNTEDWQNWLEGFGISANGTKEQIEAELKKLGVVLIDFDDLGFAGNATYKGKDIEDDMYGDKKLPAQISKLIEAYNSLQVDAAVNEPAGAGKSPKTKTIEGVKHHKANDFRVNSKMKTLSVLDSNHPMGDAYIKGKSGYVQSGYDWYKFNLERWANRKKK